METTTEPRVTGRYSEIPEVQRAVAFLDEAYVVMEDARRVHDEAVLSKQVSDRAVKVRELESTFGAGWEALVRARNALANAGVDTTRFDRLGEDLKATAQVEPSLHDASFLPDYGQILGDGWQRLAEPAGIEAPVGGHDRNTTAMWRVHYGKSAVVATVITAVCLVATVAAVLYEPWALVWTVPALLPSTWWAQRELRGWWKFRGLARRS